MWWFWNMGRRLNKVLLLPCVVHTETETCYLCCGEKSSLGVVSPPNSTPTLTVIMKGICIPPHYRVTITELRGLNRFSLILRDTKTWVRRSLRLWCPWLIFTHGNGYSGGKYIALPLRLTVHWKQKPSSIRKGNGLLHFIYFMSLEFSLVHVLMETQLHFQLLNQ